MDRAKKKENVQAKLYVKFNAIIIPWDSSGEFELTGSSDIAFGGGYAGIYAAHFCPLLA